MKTLKDSLNEGFLRRNLGLGKEVLIEKWLEENYIKNYTINPDSTIDVKGGVNLSRYKEKQLPDYIQFGKITEDFYIYGCPKLESLEGCPKEVGMDFRCNNCHELKSLRGAPQEVGGGFWCYNCGEKFTKDDVKKICKVKGDIIY